MIYLVVNSSTKRIKTASAKCDTLASDGEVLLEISGDFSQFEHHPCEYLVEGGALVHSPKPVDVMAVFNPALVIATVNAQITIAQRNKLIPYMAGLQAYMEYKFEDGTRNFRDAKLSLEDLNSDQRVTDAELALIKAAIMAQGINLDDF